jgi:hypothetical protein
VLIFTSVCGHEKWPTERKLRGTWGKIKFSQMVKEDFTVRRWTGRAQTKEDLTRRQNSCICLLSHTRIYMYIDTCKVI